MLDKLFDQDEEMQEEEGMTVQEAGQMGGQTTSQKYGKEFYEEIGKKGGEAVKDKYGSEFYEEIGKKGGEKVKELIEKGKQVDQQADQQDEEKW